MLRYSTYTVPAILDLLDDRSAAAAVFGSDPKPKLTSDRMLMFKTKGIACVTCGLTGTFFALEAVRDERPHLNLYALGANGAEVLFTKDHIQPKSKGGANTLANYQPMCEPCNTAKADTFAV